MISIIAAHASDCRIRRSFERPIYKNLHNAFSQWNPNLRSASTSHFHNAFSRWNPNLRVLLGFGTCCLKIELLHIFHIYHKTVATWSSEGDGSASTSHLHNAFSQWNPNLRSGTCCLKIELLRIFHIYHKTVATCSSEGTEQENMFRCFHFLIAERAR
ncbi:hypothetical protein BT93_L2586 [Corymbia citriodora subsp. variegata]|uniref:Uncharacterized protein n=1 Tax=Corymbia citriodora subsp. variegata TaxID=360336 RepID=A0A8T0CJ13_CORYI|nr:hypothetical protein BT93_L2586 [Corymbia citriodora subsp. variegata]